MRGTLRLPLLLLVPFLHSAKAPRDRFADSESCAEGDSSLAAGSANNHRRRATRTDCAIPLAPLINFGPQPSRRDFHFET